MTPTGVTLNEVKGLFSGQSEIPGLLRRINLRNSSRVFRSQQQKTPSISLVVAMVFCFSMLFRPAMRCREDTVLPSPFPSLETV